MKCFPKKEGSERSGSHVIQVKMVFMSAVPASQDILDSLHRTVSRALVFCNSRERDLCMTLCLSLTVAQGILLDNQVAL